MKYFSPLFLWILLCGAGHAKLFADEIMPPPALLKDPKLLLKWQTQQQQQSESFQQLRQLREQAAERKAEYETAKIEFNAQNTKLLRLSRMTLLMPAFSLRLKMSTKKSPPIELRRRQPRVDGLPLAPRFSFCWL